MQCNECLKELNEMTIYCDRCGAQLSKEKMPLSFEIIEKNVLPIHLETPYGRSQMTEIKNAYFLSNIRKDFRGFKRKYIDQYIDYVLLKIYYLKNKAILTTNDYDPQKAIQLLHAFESKKISKEVYEILKEEYGDDYENRVIPKSITERVEKVYLHEYNISNLSGAKFAVRTIISTLIGAFKAAIILGAIGAILYFVLLQTSALNLLDIVLSTPIAMIGTGVLVLIVGYLLSLKKREFYPLEHIINSNAEFKRHIKVEMKKRMKTLRYRMKKNSNK